MVMPPMLGERTPAWRQHAEPATASACCCMLLAYGVPLTGADTDAQYAPHHLEQRVLAVAIRRRCSIQNQIRQRALTRYPGSHPEEPQQGQRRGLGQPISVATEGRVGGTRRR